jgi:hypothetical protein
MHFQQLSNVISPIVQELQSGPATGPIEPPRPATIALGETALKQFDAARASFHPGDSLETTVSSLFTANARLLVDLRAIDGVKPRTSSALGNRVRADAATWASLARQADSELGLKQS